MTARGVAPATECPVNCHYGGRGNVTRMSTEATAPTIDVDVPRFNQGVIAVVGGIAFLLDVPWLVGLAFAVLAISWAGGPRVAPLTRLWIDVVRPRLRPDGPRAFEDARPPRFAQLLGTVVLGAATVAFLVGLPAVGWALTLVVVALAALAATTEICVGCLLYRWATGR